MASLRVGTQITSKQAVDQDLGFASARPLQHSWLKEALMRGSWLWLVALLFAGCPLEWKCVSTEPRPAPATLAQINEELVNGLERCGYVAAGRRGAITVVRVESGASEELMGCMRSCLHALRNDCEALLEMACLEAVPAELTACSQDCSMCRHMAMKGACGGPEVRCGVGRDGMAPLLSTEKPAEAFACGDGSGAVAADHVCDFVEDCPDGSDEAPTLGCARLSCTGADEELAE
jgi:hypothetical protein